MRESVKAVLALLLLVAIIAAAVAWAHDRPDPSVRAFRVGGPIAALVVLAALLKFHLRRDLAPDYLRQAFGSYFNRDGFCFAFALSVVDGVCWIEAYFQNQRDRPCRGRIALRPARGFWLGRAEIETLVWEIDCEPAAFGVARQPIPLSRKVQGKRQTFEVGASVDHPEGRGDPLRFHDGVFLRTNADFGNAFGAALVLAGVVTGQVVLVKPAKTVMVLPAGVAEELPRDLRPEVETLWKLGDPPLDLAAALIRRAAP